MQGTGRPPIPQTQRRLKFQDKVTVKEHYYERYAGLSHIERRIIANRSYEGSKTSRNIQTRSAVDIGMDVDEHDTCISHRPGYHGPSDKEGSLQDKALNVGVLNWDPIDKWKHNQRGVVETGRHDASSTNGNSWSSLTSKLYYESYAPASKQKASVCSDHSITSTIGYTPGEPNRERIVCLLTPQKPISDALTKLPRTERPSSRNSFHLHPAREEHQKGPSLNLKDDELYNYSKSKTPAGVYETKKVLNKLQRSCSKNLPQTELYSEIRRTISNMRSIESPDTDRPKISTISDRKMETKIRKQLSSSSKLNDAICTQKHEKIFVLLSTDAHSTTSGDFFVPESQLATDKVLGSNWNSVSDMLSEEGNMPNHLSLSSPQPQNSDSDGCTSVDSNIHPIDNHNTISRSKASQIYSFTNDACVQGKEQISEHGELSSPGSSQRSDHIYLVRAAPNTRNPSPLRHISNGFSRMRKSLSSKDISVIAPSNSKRFPRSVGVPIPVETFKDKAEAPKKVRSSSPLRRLIDPILKPKAAIVSPYVDEHIGPAGGAKMLDNVARFSQVEKKNRDTVQALLQYSTKNGLPMFKFVGKKKGDALVATIANSSAFDKQDLSFSFTLYSVNESTKNSSWMYQGRTGKSCGYLYNIVGQMKGCMLSCDETTDVSSSKHPSAVEFTLVSVQPSKVDQETMKVKLTGELAALVVKAPKDSSRIGEKTKDREMFLKKFSECLSHDTLSNMTGSCKTLSTTVILPAGVHTLPNKRAPSPLLHRWRSGGSCDCGGWDVGCNLSLLHNENDKKCCEPAEQSKDTPAPECFQLFSQTRAHGKGSSFRLTPFNKGIYSVDFKPSTMSDLQAFFISISVLSSLVTFDLSEGTE